MDILPTFAALGLSYETLNALMAKGFEEPTEIQRECIPLLLQEGTEVVGQAQTGTGKTAAFALPIIETVNGSIKAVQALILTPTRELALQVAEEINSLKGERRLEVAPIYGGASMEVQLRKLKKGAQIVVGTPGRVLDHIKRGSLKLGELEFMVLDEADEMLDMGFIEDIESVLKATPSEKRMLMFSATMPKEILKLAETFMRDPKIIRTQSTDAATSAADQIYYEVREADKTEALTRIIDRDKEFYGVVFSRTKLQCDEIAHRLLDQGYDAAALHGDLSQRERETILKRFKERQLTILVATDVAARGLDIKDLTHVINYSLPQDPEIYIHRVGRTGRAGRTGTAITFITPSEARRFAYIKKASKSEIRKEEVPTAKEVIASKRERLKEELSSALSQKPKASYKELAEELLEGRDALETLSSILSFFYKDELDESQYREIKSISSKKKEHKNERDRRDNAERPSLDSSGYTRLFIAKGKRDGITKRDLANIIISQTGARNSELDDIVVMDEFSFVSAPFDTAEKILKAFERRNDRHGKALVSRAKMADKSERNNRKSLLQDEKPRRERRKEAKPIEDFDLDELRNEDSYDRFKKPTRKTAKRSGKSKGKPALAKSKGRKNKR